MGGEEGIPVRKATDMHCTQLTQPPMISTCRNVSMQSIPTRMGGGRGGQSALQLGDRQPPTSQHLNMRLTASSEYSDKNLMPMMPCLQ